jgi:transposase
MIRLNITESEKDAIAEALDDPSIDERLKKRLLVIRMHDLNVPHSVIARTLNVSLGTVTNYLKIYLANRMEGLLENRYYQPVSRVEPFLDDIRQSLDSEPVSTVKEAAARILKISGVTLSEAQARRIMKRLGLQYRKAASIPGKADPQMQFDFLTEELLPRLEEAREGKRRVFFVDASHFVLGSFLGMVWCFSRLFVRSASGRQRYNVLGAVETRDHEMVTIRTTGSINADTILELIQKIGRLYPADEITLVMDNARYQYNRRVWELAKYLNIELLYLPPYSPNLNLIERVWRLVKSKCLRNKYYEDFATFRGEIDKFLDSLAGENKHLMKSLLTERFQTFEIPKT